MPEDFQPQNNLPTDLGSLTQGLSQPPPQQGPPQQGMTPNIVALIQGLASPKKGQVVNGVPQRPESRVDALHEFLGNFLTSLSSGLQAGGTGPGANGRAFGAAIGAPHQADLANYQLQQQAQAQQSLEQERQSQADYRSAQAAALQDQITLPNGMTVPRSLGEKMLLAQQNNAAAQQRVETQANTSKANTQANIGSREKVAAQTLAEKASEFRTSEAGKRQLAQMNNQAKLDVAKMTAGKAPAAILQSAVFAQGGVSEMNKALGLMDDFEKQGILGTIPANKIENLIFKKGFADPSMTPAQRAQIGQLRSAVSNAASALLRAHTGRTSNDIYEDFKSRFGINQDWSALRGAIEDSIDLAQHYVDAASTTNINALRNGEPANPSQAETRTYNGATYTRSAPNQPWVKQNAAK